MSWVNPINKETLNKILSEGQFIIYDLETTGLKPDVDRIIELSAVRYLIKNDKISEDERVTFYIKPLFPISDKIAEITGYTNEFFEDKLSESEVFDDIYCFFENTSVIGYNNSSFDDKFMKELYKRNNAEFAPYNSADVLKMARELIPKGETENYKLATIANYYGIANDITFHKAFDDVKATARLCLVFIEEYKNQIEITKETIKPDVLSISFWEGFKGYSRIYVNTTSGNVYYDIRRKIWDGKDVDVSELDMSSVELQSWKLAKVDCESDFAKFKGYTKKG